MKIIGLVGGVGSGKSTVARMLQDLGASVIDVDKIGHEVLCLPEIITQMKSRWHGFMDHSDTVGADERHEIAKIVFEDYKELDFLEAITWTPMRRIIEEKMELFKFSSILVLDFPLLFESGLDKECDEVWYVDCPREQRFKNFRSRRIPYGESESESRKTFEAREKRQKPINFKIEYSDVIIHNDMGDGLKQEVEEIWNG